MHDRNKKPHITTISDQHDDDVAVAIPPSSATSREERSPRRQPRSIFQWIITMFMYASAIAAMASYSVLVQLSSSSLPPLAVDGVPSSFASASLPKSSPYHSYHLFDEADDIIKKAYAETYARMAPCKDGDVEEKCIGVVVEHFENGKQTQSSNGSNYTTTTETNGNNTNLPWWFQTLLRDIPTNGAYGFWHHFSTSDPPIKFCAIGKNGSTEWRKVFKSMNNGKFNTRTFLDEKSTPNTVFIRDPLERLLSGYLDKCVKEGIRKSQGHCEPNAIFGVDFLEQKRKRKGGQQYTKIPPDVTTVIQGMDKEMFATYVDLLPLKWNVHFVPQAIFCDLYRNIGKYEFVGIMGKSFLSELNRMATTYGGLLPEVLDEVFQYRSFVSHEGNVDNGNETATINNASLTHENIGSENGHSTKAPAKVARYYSARAVRRALEYLSIDYVTLGLDVPDWARQMLMDDPL